MQIEHNQTVYGYDLAEVLRDNQGTFLAEQGGQTFIAVAESGHSISLLKPIGKPKPNFAAVSAGVTEPWSVTKLSEQSLARELTNQSAMQDRRSSTRLQA